MRSAAHYIPPRRDYNSLRAGQRRPNLLEDLRLRENIAIVDHELDFGLSDIVEQCLPGLTSSFYFLD